MKRKMILNKIKMKIKILKKLKMVIKIKNKI